MMMMIMRLKSLVNVYFYDDDDNAPKKVWFMFMMIMKMLLKSFVYVYYDDDNAHKKFGLCL